jgi:hypothetical protein
MATGISSNEPVSCVLRREEAAFGGREGTSSLTSHKKRLATANTRSVVTVVTSVTGGSRVHVVGLVTSQSCLLLTDSCANLI